MLVRIYMNKNKHRVSGLGRNVNVGINIDQS